MVNASTNVRRPNATYIPPARVGGRVGYIGMLCVGSARLFGYQHVGIGWQREGPTRVSLRSGGI